MGRLSNLHLESSVRYWRALRHGSTFPRFMLIGNSTWRRPPGGGRGGGIFERMIKSAKRCLRKSVGRNCLSYDEFLTLIIEVEAVLNSRPLAYLSSEDVEEPLTPSHLLVGYRILTLPDPTIPDDPDYSPEGMTRRMSHLSRVLKHFWNRWKKEYLLELREFHRMH